MNQRESYNKTQSLPHHVRSCRCDALRTTWAENALDGAAALSNHCAGAFPSSSTEMEALVLKKVIEEKGVSLYLMCLIPSICLSVHLFIQLSVHPPPTHSFIHLSVCPSSHLSVYLSIQPFICPSTHSSICPSVCLFVHQLINPTACLSVHPLICPSVHPSICPSVCPSLAAGD